MYSTCTCTFLKLHVGTGEPYQPMQSIHVHVGSLGISNKSVGKYISTNEYMCMYMYMYIQ